MSSEVCELSDGRRVRFNLKKRDRDGFYSVSFRGPDGARREPSTKESSKRRAQDAAIDTIKRAYEPDSQEIECVEWDAAIKTMVRHMKAAKLRPKSIEQYEFVVKSLRKEFPDSKGPADVTPAMAEEYKVKRIEADKSARTVEGNLGNLSIVFNWLKNTCKIVKSNPFADVNPPKYDKVPPRVVSEKECKAFFDWLSKRWQKWRFPVLFLEVKSAIGCRISELATASTVSLSDGRLRFTSETTKGRKERACRLPVGLYKELEAIAGPSYVFEAFAEQLRQQHLKRGRLNHAKAVKDFTPPQLVNWIQNEAQAYFDQTGAKHFKLHNLRGTAMSRARMSGVTESDAAIAFGCSPQTMRSFYLNLDEERIADDVFTRIQSGVA